MATNIKPLEARVRREAGGAAVVDLHGDIDKFSEAVLNDAYAEAERGDPNVIVLNFTHVNYINSTGIALIVGLLAQARKAHRRLVTFGLSPHYQEIFQITRLADFMNMFPDEASAVASGGAPG